MDFGKWGWPWLIRVCNVGMFCTLSICFPLLVGVLWLRVDWSDNLQWHFCISKQSTLMVRGGGGWHKFWYATPTLRLNIFYFSPLHWIISIGLCHLASFVAMLSSSCLPNLWGFKKSSFLCLFLPSWMAVAFSLILLHFALPPSNILWCNHYSIKLWVLLGNALGTHHFVKHEESTYLV